MGGRNLINSVVSSALKIIEITKFNYFYFFFLLLILSVIVDNGMFPFIISGPLHFLLDGNQIYAHQGKLAIFPIFLHFRQQKMYKGTLGTHR